MDIAIKCVTQWNAYMTMAIVMGLNLLLPNEIQERPITIQWTLSIIFLTTSTSKFLTQGPVKLRPSLDR